MNPSNAPILPKSDPKSPKKRKIHHKIMLGTVFTIGSLVLILVIAAAFFSREITKRVLNEVGKSLKTEVKIEDSELSLLRNFPDASVIFRNVRTKDAFGKKLLDADEVSFQFDLVSLFENTTRIRSVLLKDGNLNLHFDKNGRSNFDVFNQNDAKPNGKSTPNEAAIDLKLAELQNMTIDYRDAQTAQNGRFLVKNATFAGNFSTKRFNLNTKAEFISEFMNINGDQFLVNQPMGWEAVVAVDLQKNAWLLQKTNLAVGDNVLAIDGAVVREQDLTNLNLRFASQEGDVSVLFALLPASISSYFKDFSSVGTYDCSGYLRGKTGVGRYPNCSFDFNLRDGEIKSPKLDDPLTSVNFKAHAELSPTDPGSFLVENFSANFAGEPVKMTLRVTNLDDPMVDFKFSGALSLESGFGLFNEPKITEGKGKIICNSLIISGKYSNMTSMSGIAAVNTSGEINLENAGLYFNGTWIEAARGRIELADDVLTLDTIELKIKSSDLAFSGTFKHFLPAIFADSLNSKQAATSFFANLTARKLDLDELFAINSVEQNVRSGTAEKSQIDSLKSEKNTSRAQITDLLFGTFEVKIAELNYQKIDAKNFVGQLGFNHQDLRITGNIDAMGGSILMEGNAYFEEKPRLKARFTTQNLDLREVFRQCDNFGQAVILDKNLRGRLDARLAVDGFWDEKGIFDEKKLQVLAEMTGRNGELNDLAMLKDFSKYIHVEDLERVKFSKIQNFLEIKKSTIYLPAMFIQSNACNLTISGKQTFDDKIDYKFKVNAGQVLLNKMKKHQNDLDPQPEKDGLFNLFYTMCCHLDKYEVNRDKKGVKAAFEKSESRKKEIENALNDAFSRSDVAMPVTYNFQ